MLLVQFEWNKPKIQRNTVRWNKIITVYIGFAKIIWLNDKLTNIYTQAVNLGIEDIEIISNYKNKLIEIERVYEYKIEDLTVLNTQRANTIEELNQKLKKKKKNANTN